MSWSYSGPATCLKDEVRFKVGDTNPARPLLSDLEIVYCLTQAGNNVLQAAIAACEAIQGKLSGLADESVGSVSISFSQQADGYAKKAASLERRAIKTGRVRVYAGGISRTDKRQQDVDPDRVRPIFDRRMRGERVGTASLPDATGNSLLGYGTDGD